MKVSDVLRGDILLADAIESRAMMDLYDAAPDAMGATTQSARGVTVLSIRALPVNYFNRVIGLGNEVPASDADLDRIAELFRAIGIADHWIHVAPGVTGDLAEKLAARGYAPPARRSWSKFLRGTGLPPPLESGFTIRQAAAPDAAEVAQVVTTAYGLPSTVAGWFAALVGRPRWQVWVAERDTQIVATGSLYLDGEYGWLGVGATLAGHRGQGAQSSLLAARIGAAGKAGCTRVATETGDPVGDEKNPSLQNIRRAGFEAVGSRLNYAAPR
jgi:hypothetical protein